jgi:aspartyl-tRNA(Asn)/glutamyl-tRNA(Gln) amidotransferase subunit C
VKIDKNTVEKLAHLARLKFDEEAREKMTSELNVILDWIDQLNEVDTEGVEPLTNMSHETNVYREDEVKNEFSHEQALKNAPKKDSNYFRVPKVLDN